MMDTAMVSSYDKFRRGEDNKLHPTQAGLRMDSSTRWTDRFVSSSGDWSGYIFDFYYRAFQGKDFAENKSSENDPSLNPSLKGNLEERHNRTDIPVQLQKVLHFLTQDPHATYSDIAIAMGKNRDTIRLYLQKLDKDFHLIRRIGSKKKGYWEILPGNPPSETE